MIGQSLDVIRRAFQAVSTWFGVSITAVSATSLLVAGISAVAVYRFIISPIVGGRVGSSDIVRRKR